MFRDKTATMRLCHEAMLLAKLRHPNIIAMKVGVKCQASLAVARWLAPNYKMRHISQPPHTMSSLQGFSAAHPGRYLLLEEYIAGGSLYQRLHEQHCVSWRSGFPLAPISKFLRDG